MKPLAILFSLCIFCLSARADALKTDADLIQGTWRYTSISEDGQTTPIHPTDHEAAVFMVIDGNKMYMIRDGHHAENGTVKLDPSQSPKQIDTMSTDPPDAGQVNHGIYTLDGDTLKICYSDTPDRPTEFKSDRHHLVLEMARVKPGDKSTQPSP
jgi:uncharacterized protein (TIGR03067 family)